MCQTENTAPGTAAIGLIAPVVANLVAKVAARPEVLQYPFRLQGSFSELASCQIPYPVGSRIRNRCSYVKLQLKKIIRAVSAILSALAETTAVTIEIIANTLIKGNATTTSLQLYQIRHSQQHHQ